MALRLPFPMALHDVVEQASPSCPIRWWRDAQHLPMVVSELERAPLQTRRALEKLGSETLVILDVRAFVGEVLPLISTSTRWESFLRQLSYYGFSRIHGMFFEGFSHRHFLPGRPELLTLVTRTQRRRRGSSHPHPELEHGRAETTNRRSSLAAGPASTTAAPSTSRRFSSRPLRDAAPRRGEAGPGGRGDQEDESQDQEDLDEGAGEEYDVDEGEGEEEDDEGHMEPPPVKRATLSGPVPMVSVPRGWVSQRPDTVGWQQRPPLARFQQPARQPSARDAHHYFSHGLPPLAASQYSWAQGRAAAEGYHDAPAAYAHDPDHAAGDAYAGAPAASSAPGHLYGRSVFAYAQHAPAEYTNYPRHASAPAAVAPGTFFLLPGPARPADFSKQHAWGVPPVMASAMGPAPPMLFHPHMHPAVFSASAGTGAYGADGHGPLDFGGGASAAAARLPPHPGLAFTRAPPTGQPPAFSGSRGALRMSARHPDFQELPRSGVEFSAAGTGGVAHLDRLADTADGTTPEKQQGITRGPEGQGAAPLAQAQETADSRGSSVAREG